MFQFQVEDIEQTPEDNVFLIWWKLFYFLTRYEEIFVIYCEKQILAVLRWLAIVKILEIRLL